MTTNFKNMLWILMLIAVSSYSCTKESLQPKSAADSVIDLRNLPPLEINYDLQTTTQITPESGTIKEMCDGDIQMLQEDMVLFQVKATISEYGEPCFDIIKNKRSEVDRSDNAFYFDSKSTLCDNVLSYTNADTSFTTPTQMSNDFWLQVIQGYIMTDDELEQQFNATLQHLEQSGATVDRDGSLITVNEFFAGAGSATTIFNSNTFLTLFTEFISENGTKKTFNYTYTCSEDGYIIPESILIKIEDESAICKTPYVLNKWLQFSNYKLSI